MNDGTNRRELFLPFGASSYVLRYLIDGQIVVLFGFGMDGKTVKNIKTNN